MKKIYLFFIIFLFVLSTGCIHEEKVSSQSEMSYEHQSLLDTVLQYEFDWLTNGLQKAGLRNCDVWAMDEGYIQSIGEQAKVYILYDTKRYGEDSIYHDFYMAIQTSNKIILKDLKTDSYCGGYGLALYVCDVTGDGLEEIVVQSTVGMTGGTGQYLSRIFQLNGDKIQEIFYSSPINKFDTGFSNTFKNDYKLLISNGFTKYENVIDYSSSEKYKGLYFGENGIVIGNDTISCDSFFEFIPQDIDNDNIFEIICKQYTSLCGHSDYIGEAQSILKYNSQTETFEIIYAQFIQSEE